jgi:hypothetical protein
MAGTLRYLSEDVLLNTHILRQERWEEMVRHQATLWREVRRDGVSLMPERRDDRNESSHVLVNPSSQTRPHPPPPLSRRPGRGCPPAKEGQDG